jgi:hypothetical protein
VAGSLAEIVAFGYALREAWLSSAKHSADKAIKRDKKNITFRNIFGLLRNPGSFGIYFITGLIFIETCRGERCFNDDTVDGYKTVS